MRHNKRDAPELWSILACSWSYLSPVIANVMPHTSLILPAHLNDCNYHNLEAGHVV